MTITSKHTDWKPDVDKKIEFEREIEKYTHLLRDNQTEQPTIHLKLGKLYEAVGDNALAIIAYSKAARLYTNAGNTDEAIAANELIIQLAPQNKEALARLAALRLRTEREHHFEE